MKTHLLMGAAAVLSSLCFAGQAQARDCSDIRNEARLTNSLQRLEALRDEARATCTEDSGVGALIQRKMEQIQDPNASGAAQPASTGGAHARPTTSAATRPIPTLVFNRRPEGAALDPASDTSVNGIYYDQYALPLAAHETVEITMQGDGITPGLAVGTGTLPDNFRSAAQDFPQGENAHQARLIFVAPSDGDYMVIAASTSHTGPYSLLARHVEAPPPPVATPLTFEQPVTASLTTDSPVLYSDGGVSYGYYSFQAHAGERLRISMTSPDNSGLDPLLVLGRMNNGEFEQIDRDDDGGDGVNALIRFTPTEDGTYYVRARSYSPGQRGDYTLVVQRIEMLANSRQMLTRDANTWVREGAISQDSAGDAETGHYVNFEFRPERGRRYHVAAVASGFSPVVELAQLGDNDHAQDLDNYEKGSNARNPDSLEFNATRRTRYLVRVRADANAEGHFSLIITEAPPQAAPAHAPAPAAPPAATPPNATAATPSAH